MALADTLQHLAEQLSYWSKSGISEAQTSQVIILPILQALSYDIWNPHEIVAEDSSGGGAGGYRPDFTIKLEGEVKFIIEVKALNKDFTDNDRTQAVNYINALGRRWAILSNGRSWHFFDNNVSQKPAYDRLVLTVDIQDDKASSYLEKLLERSFWVSGGAEENLVGTAKEVSEDIRKRLKLGEIEQKLAKELSDGFTRDEKGLRRAIQLTLEPNERALAENSIRHLAYKLLGISSVEEKVPTSNSTDLIRQGIQVTAPVARQSKTFDFEVEIDGVRLPARNWRDLTSGLVEALLRLNKIDGLYGKYIYSSMSERVTDTGKPYPPSAYRRLSSGAYLYVHFSADGHQRLCKQLLQRMAVTQGALNIRFGNQRIRLP